MMIAQRGYDPLAVDVQKVFTFEPTPGELPFSDLLGERSVEFGPLAGPALSVGGEYVYDHDELASDLRRLSSRLLVSEDDVVLAAVSDPLKGLRVLDLALMSGAHVVIAHEPSLIGCRVLAHVYAATLVVAPNEVVRRLFGDPTLRVVDERAVVSSLSR